MVFIADLADDPYFSRPTAARKAGLGRGAAVPVLRDGEVTVVLAFFGPGEPGGQAAMFESAAWLAEQLGGGVPARSTGP
jgi:hypothetical protein